MNITIYSDNLPVEILPAYCNWILVDGIKFDEKRNTLERRETHSPCPNMKHWDTQWSKDKAFLAENTQK